LVFGGVKRAKDWQHDLTSFIASARPGRWKVFQALPIRGQNDSHVSDFAVTAQQFATFRNRHAGCPNAVFETDEAMTGSYVMVSPDGHFFDNSSGAHRFGRSILDVGVSHALGDIQIDARMFEKRGGRYEW
jgi:radical S-adenosyl methionine domain-containing protein 2